MNPLEFASARFLRAEKEYQAASLALRDVVNSALKRAPMHHIDPLTLAKIETIQRVVAEYHAIDPAAILCQCRERVYARPRQQAMAICRSLLGATFQQLGDAFGRDHGTIIYATRMVNADCSTDRSLAAEFARLTALCRAAITNQEHAA